LTLKAAKELSDYLDEVHGIKPAAGGGGRDGCSGRSWRWCSACGRGAAAEKTEFDVVLESFPADATRSASSRSFVPPPAWA
jgi:large subunit ribosomal protein L7/L12